MIKLVITDMDGTFLNSKGDFNRTLYKETKKIMKEKNVYFAPCTGKQCERIEAIFGEEDTKDLWILGDSATRIKHNGNYVYESLLPNSLGKELIQALEKIATDYTIIACTPKAAIVKDTTPKNIVDNVVRRSYHNVDFVENYNEITSDFVKITIFDTLERSFETKDKLENFFDRAYIVASEPKWIDISNYGVHKGTTVEKLQKMLDVTKEETMVFGDGWNDIELMERGGLSFAVRNAYEPLKEAADYITRSNNEDGVLRTINQLLKL